MNNIYSPTCDEYNYVIIADETPYRKLTDWRDGNAADYYLVHLETGSTPCFIMGRKKRGTS